MQRVAELDADFSNLMEERDIALQEREALWKFDIINPTRAREWSAVVGLALDAPLEMIVDFLWPPGPFQLRRPGAS